MLAPVIGALIVFSFFAREMWLQYSMIEDIESRYGGAIVGEIHMSGGEYVEAITIVDIVQLSAFDKAGIKQNDIVLTEKSIGEFLVELDQPSGSVIKLEVVDGGNGPPISQRSRRQIKLVAP